MNPRFIIIRGILAQDPAQVRLPEYDHVVETFPSDPCRSASRRTGSATAIGEQSACPECRWHAPEDHAIRKKRLDDLARNPLRGRICRHPERYPQSTSVTQKH